VTYSGATGDTDLAAGDVAGSRFRHGDSFYRVTADVVSEGGISITAEADTTMDDFDAIWAERTFDEFDAVWAERTDLQFAVAPLRDS
jgi:hypothetical protein